MFKHLFDNVWLWLQAKTGVSVVLLIWMPIVVIASITAFIFLCVSAYEWLSLDLGPVIGGWAMAGIFGGVVLISILGSAMSRRRTKQRALLQRSPAAPSILLNPKLLGLAVRAGRAPGWRRFASVAVLGLLAAHGIHSYRRSVSRE
jgi:hypothetical protein